MTADDAVLTYADWSAHGRAVAASLLALGLRRPARVAALLPNGPEFAILLYACASLGVTLVPVSTWAVEGELRRVLAASGVEYLVVDDSVPHRSAELDALAAAGGAFPQRLPFSALRDAGGDPRSVQRAASDAEDADLAVLFTSGSTGSPKGVILAQNTVAGNGAAIAQRMGLRRGDRVYSYFPMFFSGGLCNVLTGAAAAGAEVVTQARFEPASAAELIRARACTVHNVWHNGLAAVASGLTATDMRRMRRGLVLDPQLFDRFGLPFDEGINMYGMTETATAFTSHVYTDPADVRRRTHGTPLPGNELRIIDPDRSRALPDGEEGEIVVRGKGLMRGYTDGSHESLTDEEGWFHTGDIGVLDPTGQLTYTGRLKTLVKIKGLTIQPEEVEAVLTEYPGVHQAVAVGVGGHEASTLVALVVCDDGVDLADVDAHCRRELSSYKVPALRRIRAEDFPLSASRKIDRGRARELVGAA
jgi:fatty-acyl-CoA synthase